MNCGLMMVEDPKLRANLSQPDRENLVVQSHQALS